MGLKQSCGGQLPWLFGVDLVKMKSPPSVFSVQHACSYMLLHCSHIYKKYDSSNLLHGIMLIL